MGLLTTVPKVDDNAIINEVNKDYLRNPAKYKALVDALNSPFRTDTMVKEFYIERKKKAERAKLATVKRELDKLQLARWAEMVEEGLVEDVELDKVYDICKAKHPKMFDNGEEEIEESEE